MRACTAFRRTPMDSKSDFNQRILVVHVISLSILAMTAAESAFAGYSSRSIESNIMNSCKNFSINSSGLLTAICNEWDAWSVSNTEKHSIDLDSNIGNTNGELNFAANGSQSNFSRTCDTETVNVQNNQLILEASCDGPSGSQINSSIRIDHRLLNEGWVASKNTGLKWKLWFHYRPLHHNSTK